MWSFTVCYTFDYFLEVLHRSTVTLESGEVCIPIIKTIEIEAMGFKEVHRGHYVVVYDLIPLNKQLTLF